MKTKTKRSLENLIIYTDPDFPLESDNVFHSYRYYKSISEFERLNKGMECLIIIPKGNLPRARKKKVKNEPK